jgi:hypothetical protein
MRQLERGGRILEKDDAGNCTRLVIVLARV